MFAFTSALNKVSSAMGTLGFVTPENPDSPEPFNPTPVPTEGGGGVVTPNSYYTTNNQQTTTTSGDVDNSVTFQSGAIVIQANGTSPEEADRLANEIMERIARRKTLDNMAKYKDVNYENPEFAY